MRAKKESRTIEIRVTIAIKENESLSVPLNGMITSIACGHYEGKSVSPALFNAKGYNYSYTKTYKDYDEIKF